MGITISAKNDYSTLFSSLNNGHGSSNSLSSLLGAGMASDYASIKNGSYGKLMKAYYAKDGATDSVNSLVNNKNKIKEQTKTSSLDTSELTKIRSNASDLRTSADKLVEADFKDADANLASVKSLVKNYNSTIASAGNSKVDAVANKADKLVALTKNYENDLKSIGITIDKDNKLSVDADAFKAADQSKVKELFGGVGSYGYSLSNQATIVDNQAAYESLKADTYKADATFNSAQNSGNLWNSLI